MVKGLSALASFLTGVPDPEAPDPEAVSLLLFIRLAAVELSGMVTYWLPSVG